MKNHASTKRGREIERLIYERLRRDRGGNSISELLVYFQPSGVSVNGLRQAVLRLQARGQVECGLDTSVPGFPRRVWKLKANAQAEPAA